MKRDSWYAPLSLLTVAGILPKEWEVKLVDQNVRFVTDEEIQHSDLVLLTGMYSQRHDLASLARRAKKFGKPVGVGGPDVSESPGLYTFVDFRFVGEAEVYFEQFVDDFRNGKAKSIYNLENKLGDITRSPIPRYDLIDAADYAFASIQFGRGCPFQCAFCSTPVLQGRVPRYKKESQILSELDALYRMGIRGTISVTDDNLIGNTKQIKDVLQKVATFQKQRKYPFSFQVYATANLVEDDSLLREFQNANINAVFLGIESPDPEVMRAQKKFQNIKRIEIEKIRKLFQHGIHLTAGIILGEDQEGLDAGRNYLSFLQEAGIPNISPSLLMARPGTSLYQRLRSENRMLFDLAKEFEIPGRFDQGLNFVTRRNRENILRDYRRLSKHLGLPRYYFTRVRRFAGSFRTAHGRPLRLGEMLKRTMRVVKEHWRGLARSAFSYPTFPIHAAYSLIYAGLFSQPQVEIVLNHVVQFSFYNDFLRQRRCLVQQSRVRA